jgi:hypothetical protein
MSPVAGNFDPFQFPWLAHPADPTNAGDFRNDLIGLAAEQGVGYWDLTTPWGDYIQNSGLTYNDFLRDGIHMSGRGQLLTGRIMESFFTPVPEPSSLLLAGLAGGVAVAGRRRKARAVAQENAALS